MYEISSESVVLGFLVKPTLNHYLVLYNNPTI